jgi:peptidoglycan/xylan/chitin deacetylase (PgdA/CDA1 family)
MSKRQRFASLLHRTGLLRATRALRWSVSSPQLSVLTYHRFPDPDGDASFDDGVVDVTPGCFDRQLSCLKKHFTLVGIEELSAFAAGKTLPPNSVAVTFDDGYLDNYLRALPILKRHDAKAIFFLSTAYISERRLYWWDRVAYIVKRSALRSIALEYPLRLDIPLSDRALAANCILRLIKTHQPLDLERFLDELAKTARVTWSRKLEQSFAERLLLTWDHARALRKAGMDVQSHTRTHRVLQTLPPHELHDELAGSRADLERELGEQPRAVAYPVGNPVLGASPIRAALEKAGYQLGFSNGTGSNSLNGRVDPFNICRQTVGLSVSEDYLLAMLMMPSLAPKQPSRQPVR